VPGIAAAVVIAVVLNGAIATVFGVATQYALDFSLSGFAMGLGVGLGFALPMLANIAPIRVRRAVGAACAACSCLTCLVCGSARCPTRCGTRWMCTTPT
jgi:hypothetical protein